MIEIKFVGDDVCKLRAEMMAFCNVNAFPIPADKAVMHQMTENGALPPKEKKARKPKAEEVVVDTISAPLVVVTRAAEGIPLPVGAATNPANEPAAVVVPSEKDVQDAVVAVNDKFGIDKAIECLSKFHVKRARELHETQRAAFIETCKGILA